MDDIVLRGMAKWPNVPAVYGWVSLDRRGNWLIRGERISNPNVVAFIGRNYARDDKGRWYFQNGPQRVFVALEYTPFVFRVVGLDGGPLAFESHTGRKVAAISGVWLDDAGMLLIDADEGVGVVSDLDLDKVIPHFTGAGGERLADDVLAPLLDFLRRQCRAALGIRVQDAIIRVEPIRADDVPGRFGFMAKPAPPPERQRYA